MNRLIIRNGQVVSPTQIINADVLIEGEKITGITAPGAVQWSDAREIDATGCYVMPGVVDAHTHIQLDTGVYQTDDNWEIGTKVAAYGGVTTVVDFATQFPGMNFREALEHRLKECKPAYIDYGLHMMVTDLARDPEEAAKDLAELRDMGVPSIKLYTTYRPNYYADDAKILHTLRAMPDDMLAMFHCENDDMVRVATERLVEHGKTSWRYHGESRPEEAETEAALRVYNLATIAGDKPIYIVHCSARKTVAELLRAVGDHFSSDSLYPHSVYWETCIQYIHLEDSAYEGEHPEHFILQPPLRDSGSSKVIARYYNGDSRIAVLSTDHCDYSLEKKIAHNDFRVTPGGLPGLETLLPLAYTAFTEGVGSGIRLRMKKPLNTLVEVLSTNPAKLFGLYPKKGIIQIGSDADIVIYDPEPEVVIQQENLHTIGGYSPYEGMTVQGKVRNTISRGHVIIDNGEFHGIAGRGRFLPGLPFKPLESW